MGIINPAAENKESIRNGPYRTSEEIDRQRIEAEYRKAQSFAIQQLRSQRIELQFPWQEMNISDDQLKLIKNLLQKATNLITNTEFKAAIACLGPNFYFARKIFNENIDTFNKEYLKTKLQLIAYAEAYYEVGYHQQEIHSKEKSNFLQSLHDLLQRETDTFINSMKSQIEKNLINKLILESKYIITDIISRVESINSYNAIQVLVYFNDKITSLQIKCNEYHNSYIIYEDIYKSRIAFEKEKFIKSSSGMIDSDLYLELMESNIGTILLNNPNLKEEVNLLNNALITVKKEHSGLKIQEYDNLILLLRQKGVIFNSAFIESRVKLTNLYINLYTSIIPIPLQEHQNRQTMLMLLSQQQRALIDSESIFNFYRTTHKATLFGGSWNSFSINNKQFLKAKLK